MSLAPPIEMSLGQSVVGTFGVTYDDGDRALRIGPRPRAQRNSSWATRGPKWITATSQFAILVGDRLVLSSRWKHDQYPSGSLTRKIGRSLPPRPRQTHDKRAQPG